MLFLAGMCLFAPLAFGQGMDKQASKPVISAVRLASAPVLDGRVIGDAAWTDVRAASGFVQSTPNEGQPSSQRTELRVAYTDDTLFIGIICFDDKPGAIVVSDSRRDASLEESDSLTLIFDTYSDGQNGFVFGTNPSGLEYDGQAIREGSGGLSRQGSGGGFNINWDGVWQVETSVNEQGWSAEFAIPFKTLRYPEGEIQQWDFNVQRNIRRRNEQAFWAPLGRQHSIYRVFDAGTLSGLAVPSQKNLQIIP